MITTNITISITISH